jgi:transcriptional regulator with XRE-family HTH domain
MAASDPNFGVRLKELRSAAGLTQSKLAEKAGLSKGTVAALEQGTYDATWPTVQALAVALGMDCRAFGVAAASKSPTPRGRPRTADNSDETPSAKSRSKIRKASRAETPRRGGAHPDFPVGSTVRVRPMGRGASPERRALVGRVGLVVESSRAEVVVEFPGLPHRHRFKSEELDAV